MKFQQRPSSDSVSRYRLADTGIAKQIGAFLRLFVVKTSTARFNCICGRKSTDRTVTLDY